MRLDGGSKIVGQPSGEMVISTMKSLRREICTELMRVRSVLHSLVAGMP
jgi:hypothetical protein